MTVRPHRHTTSTLPSQQTTFQGPRNSPSSVAVVGAGLAGLRSVAALRDAGFTGELTLIGDELHRPYDRPALSKKLFSRLDPQLLEDDLSIDLETLATVWLGERVHTASHDGKQFSLSTNQRTLQVDALVAASGSIPVHPVSLDPALVLRTIEDAGRLRSRLLPGHRVAIVGAGWIGCEIASVASTQGCQVIVIEAGPAPLTNALGPVLGSTLMEWFDQAGVEFRPNTRAEQVIPTGLVVQMNGQLERLEADVVLVALGVRPDLRWLDQLVSRENLDPTGHLPVDAEYRALAGPPRLYAVGDCAARRSPRFGVIPGGHWDGALRDPDGMARSLLTDLGHSELEDSLTEQLPDDVAPYVFSTQFGHELALFGHPRSSDAFTIESSQAALSRPQSDTNSPMTVSWTRSGPEGDLLAARLIIDQPREVSRTRKLFRSQDLPRVP